MESGSLVNQARFGDEGTAVSDPRKKRQGVHRFVSSRCRWITTRNQGSQRYEVTSSAQIQGTGRRPLRNNSGDRYPEAVQRASETG